MQLSRTQKVVTYHTASALVQAALSHAMENGWGVAAAVVDPSGNVVASGRLDGVPPTVLDFASDKAFTAALGNSTRAFFERMSSSPELHMGMINRPRLCAWDGGQPIVEDGALIGAIGVSGAAGPDDVACIRIALQSIGL